MSNFTLLTCAHGNVTRKAVLTPFLHEMTRPSVPSLWYPSLEVSNRKHKRQTSNILKQAYIDKTLTTTKFILDHIQISDTVVSTALADAPDFEGVG